MTLSTSSFNQGLCAFLDQSPTPFHAVQTITAHLVKRGFTILQEGEKWGTLAAGAYLVTRNDSSIIAFVLTEQDIADVGFNMVGAHTDSPCLKVKPRPETWRYGLYQLGVEVYGGALLNPWFDRDLSMAGRVSYRDSHDQIQQTLVNFTSAVAVIPSLAIHLDREANTKKTINPQQHLPPILLQSDDGEKPDFRALLEQQCRREHPDLDIHTVLDYEISFYDTQKAAVIGLSGDFISSARLDNLLSCYVGLQALLAADGSRPALLVCTDHEEVGSQSTSGAQGTFLQSVLQRLTKSTEDYQRLVDHSMFISADNAHGIHPNYATKHDAEHGPLLNKGPVIKTNANQRYATNSETSAIYRQLCAEENVPVQDFVVRSDMACGSTIGPITAGQTGIKTIDIGVPTFAMHSIREIAGSQDAAMLAKVLTRFYNHLSN